MFDTRDLITPSLRKSLELFTEKISLPPTKVTLSEQNRRKSIRGFDDPVIYGGDLSNLLLESKKQEYQIFIDCVKREKYELNVGFFFYTPFLIENLPNEQIIFFFKELVIQMSSMGSANALDSGLNAQIVYTNYEPFDFTGNNSDFTGFRWLNYLGPEEMALNGGKALYDLPYLTKVEPLGEGIFIQVGETPNDARTEEGEQQLFKATEAWWEMMQKKGR